MAKPEPRRAERTYTDPEKRAALVAFVELGTTPAAGRALGIPSTTIDSWVAHPKWQADLGRIREVHARKTDECIVAGAGRSASLYLRTLDRLEEIVEGRPTLPVKASDLAAIARELARGTDTMKRLSSGESGAATRDLTIHLHAGDGHVETSRPVERIADGTSG